MDAEAHRKELGGSRCLDLRVSASPRMVSKVRRAFGEFPMPTPLLDDAKLLVSELVTNSIRHAGLFPSDTIRVKAEWTGTRLRVDVIDRGDPPEPRSVAGAIRPAPGAESGWGLYLVERLATRWGRGPGRYWFELERRADPPSA